MSASSTSSQVSSSGWPVTEQAAHALGEPEPGGAQGVLEQDAGGRRAILWLAHARAPRSARSAAGTSASRSEMTRLTASSPTVTP